MHAAAPWTHAPLDAAAGLGSAGGMQSSCRRVVGTAIELPSNTRRRPFLFGDNLWAGIMQAEAARRNLKSSESQLVRRGKEQ